MNEIWKDIEGYEGKYQVSNLGNVKSLSYLGTGKEKLLKPFKTEDGYLFIGLNKNNKRKFYKIHRLVAQAFIDNPNNYPIINHKDENKRNNNMNNLEWCTIKYNINYGTATKRRSEKLFKPIYCLELDKYYKSVTQASEELKIKQANISAVLNGRFKQTKGYTFRYANQVLYKGGK